MRRPFRGFPLWFPRFGAAILIYVGRDHATLAAKLCPCAHVWIGLISYSLYLCIGRYRFARYVLLRTLAGVEILGVVAASIDSVIARGASSKRHCDAPSGPSAVAGLRGHRIGVVGSRHIGIGGHRHNGFAARFPDFRTQQVARPVPTSG